MLVVVLLILLLLLLLLVLDMVCVIVGGPVVVAVPTRNNWNPLSVFNNSAGVCPVFSVLRVI